MDVFSVRPRSPQDLYRAEGVANAPAAKWWDCKCIFWIVYFIVQLGGLTGQGKFVDLIVWE